MPKGVEFAAGQAPAETQAQAAVAEHIKYGGVFGHAQGVMPGQDDGGGAHVDVGMPGSYVGHQLQVVRDEGVVVEVVFGGPEAVEAGVGGQLGETEFLLPHPGVGASFPAVAGEDHHHAYVHLDTPFACLAP